MPTLRRNGASEKLKSLMSVIFLPAILEPEMAAPILWVPGIFGSFCWKTPMPIEFLVLGGVVGFFEGGSGNCGSVNSILWE